MPRYSLVDYKAVEDNDRYFGQGFGKLEPSGGSQAEAGRITKAFELYLRDGSCFPFSVLFI